MSLFSIHLWGECSPCLIMKYVIFPQIVQGLSGAHLSGGPEEPGKNNGIPYQ